MTQHSTSLPSADVATKRSGETSLNASPSGLVSQVSWCSAPVAAAPVGRSATASSPVDTGEPATNASVPPAQSHSLIHRSPPATGEGDPAPSDCDWYRCTFPWSSTANRTLSPIHTGGSVIPNGEQFRSRLAVSTCSLPEATFTTATCRLRGFSSGVGLT